MTSTEKTEQRTSIPCGSAPSTQLHQRPYDRKKSSIAVYDVTSGATQSLFSTTTTANIRCIQKVCETTNKWDEVMCHKQAEEQRERTWQARLGAVFVCLVTGSNPLPRWQHDQWHDDCMVVDICIETTQWPWLSSRRDSIPPTFRYQPWASVTSCSTQVYVQWCPNYWDKKDKRYENIWWVRVKRTCKV